MLDLLDSTRQVVLRRSLSVATVTFVADGEVADPGAVTASVTADDGTILIASAPADGTGTGARRLTLASPAADDLDVLTVEWVSRALGTLETQVEVVGGFVCGIGQIDSIIDQRGESGSPSSGQVPFAVKVAARTVATDALEGACNVAFTARYARDRFDGSGGDVLLPTPQVRGVRSISTAGSAVDLADVGVTRAGGLYRPGGWNGGRRAYDIAWEHGFRTPPADVSRAVALLAVYTMMDGPWDDRGYGVVDQGGFARLLTAGVSGAAFSIPEVQAVVQRFRYPVVA